MSDFVEKIVYEADIDDVKAKLRELSRHTRSVERETADSTQKASAFWSSMGDRISGVGARVVGVVADMAKYATVGLVGLGSAAAVMGLKTAGSLEQAQIGFETMLGSAQKATGFLEDLEKFAAKTPFEFPELVSAAQKMLAFGFESDKVLPTLTSIGDAAAGLGAGGEGVNRMVSALGQMSAKQKISTEEMLQLTELGIPAFEILAEKMGMSVGELQNLMAAAGGAGASELFNMGGLDALLEGLDDRFGGLMDKQSASLMGLFSTLKDTVSMGLARAMQPVAAMLQEHLPAAIGVAETVLAAAGGFIADFVAQIPNLFDVIKDNDDLAGGLGEVIDAMFGNTGALVGPIRELVLIVQDLWAVFRDGIVPVVAELTDALPSFLTPLGLARDLLGWVAQNAEALQPVIAALLTGFVAWKVVAGIIKAIAIAQGTLNLVMAMNPIVLVVAALAALAAGLIYAYNHSETFREVVQAVFGAVTDAAGWLWDKIVGLFNWLGDNWQLVLAVLTGPIGLAVYFIREKWDGIVDFITGLPSRIASAARGMWDGLVDAFRSAINWIIRRWNALEFSIPGFDPPGPGPAFPGFVLGVPNIPLLAAGGRIMTGGLSIVGDAGPELLSLPSGATVAPLPNGGGGGSLVVYLTVQGSVVTERELVSTVEEGLAVAARRGGGVFLEVLDRRFSG